MRLNLAPEQVEILWHRGNGFSRGRFDYVDASDVAIDITGFTVSLVIATALDAAATVTLTDGAGITVTHVSGQIAPSATATDMAALTALGPGKYVYEINIDDGAGDIRTIAAGRFISSDNVGV